MASHYHILHFFRAYHRNEFPVAASSHFGLQTQSLCRPICSKFSASEADTTVSYLVNSCGLSPESAIAASHKVKFQSVEKSHSVLALLRDYELSETQISNAIKKHPQILVVDANKTLKPKLEFLYSIGIQKPELAKKISCYPKNISWASLENRLIPSYNYLKSVLLSDVRVIKVWKYNPVLFWNNLSLNVVPNIGLVRELGMPQPCIDMLLTYYAVCLMRKPKLFGELVGEVEQMGFDIEKSTFVQAVLVLSTNKKMTWKRNQEVYRRWGWSEDDILSAFRLHPLCMVMSEKKIMESVDFLVNKMGWQSQKIARHPSILCYSLKKRVIPRCSVLRVLHLKGLINEDKIGWSNVFNTSEKIFLDRFVTRYHNEVPHLLSVYQKEMDLQQVLEL